MKFRIGNGLLLLNLLVIILGIATIFPPLYILRFILGLLLATFIPGYALIVALSPKKTSLDGIERLALSCISSMVMAPLIALLLNYIWNISSLSLLVSLSVFTFATSAIAWYRWQRLAEPERLTFSFTLSLPSWKAAGATGKALFIILAVVIVGLIGTIVYAATMPRPGEQFTEFYILGPQGKMSGYQTNLKLGEETKVRLVIVNYEDETVNYRVEVAINGTISQQIGPLVLSHGEKWQSEVKFTPTTSGYGQKVEFILYRNDEPYRRPLYYWIDVI